MRMIQDIHMMRNMGEMPMLIRYSATEPSHPDGRRILDTLTIAKGVTMLVSNQRASDYSCKTTHGQRVGVEYVTPNGLYQDLLSERLDYKIGMLVQDYDIPILLVGGRLTESREGGLFIEGRVYKYLWASYLRKKARLQWNGVIWEELPSVAKAANYILKVFRSFEATPLEPLQEKPSRTRILPMGSLDGQVLLLSQFPGLGDTRARALLEWGGNLQTALRMLIEGKVDVPGIGKVTLKEITAFMEKTKDEARSSL